MTHIGKNIRYLRRTIRDITQKALGEAIGVTDAVITTYEKSGNIPKRSQEDLAKFFGYTVEQLNSPTFIQDISGVITQGGTDNQNIINNGIIRAKTIGDVVNEQACTIEILKTEVEHLKAIIADKTEIINLQREQIEILKSKSTT
jgi:transcriptional regulator with XRE-family HTH domain